MLVIWVDDNKLIRLMGTEMLQSLGCETIAASSAGEAIEILESRNVDILISDIAMPGMNGWELMENIRDLYPSMKRIILSGWDESRDIARMKSLRIDHLIKKPVRRSEISRIFEELKS